MPDVLPFLVMRATVTENSENLGCYIIMAMAKEVYVSLGVYLTIDIIRVTWIGNAYRLICPILSTVEVRGLVGELVYNQLK